MYKINLIKLLLLEVFISRNLHKTKKVHVKCKQYLCPVILKNVFKTQVHVYKNVKYVDNDGVRLKGI